MVEYIKIMSDINRIRIFLLLEKAHLCVCELEVILNLSQPNISKHLTCMKKSNLILATKQSLWSVYSLNQSFMIEHELLVTYIKSQANKNDIIVSDHKRLNKYLKKEISCKLASENKLAVQKIIE